MSNKIQFSRDELLAAVAREIVDRQQETGPRAYVANVTIGPRPMNLGIQTEAARRAISDAIAGDVPRDGCHWTEAEDAILREQFSQTNRRSLGRLVPGRSAKAVWARAAKLSLYPKERRHGKKPRSESRFNANRGWTAEQDQLLLGYAKDGTDIRLVATRMGRTVAALEQRVRRLTQPQTTEATS